MIKTKINKEKGLLSLSRGSGYYNTFSKLLEDGGASITFNYKQGNKSLLLDFGYTAANGDREYRRDLEIGIKEIVELRNYLNGFLDNQLQSQIAFIFHDPFFALEKIKDQISIKSSQNIKLYSYKLGFYRVEYYNNRILTQLEKAKEESDYTFAKLVVVDEFEIIKLQNLYHEEGFYFETKKIVLPLEDRNLEAFYFNNRASSFLKKARLSKNDKQTMKTNCEAWGYPSEFIESW